MDCQGLWLLGCQRGAIRQGILRGNPRGWGLLGYLGLLELYPMKKYMVL
jgi:hypothetical protein